MDFSAVTMQISENFTQVFILLILLIKWLIYVLIRITYFQVV